jgi:hypothetical protein
MPLQEVQQLMKLLKIASECADVKSLLVSAKKVSMGGDCPYQGQQS